LSALQGRLREKPTIHRQQITVRIEDEAGGQGGTGYRSFSCVEFGYGCIIDNWL
jgi:hypothetical protein